MTDKIWSEALIDLNGQMTQATYDRLLGSSRLERVNGHYVLLAASKEIQASLEHENKQGVSWLDRIAKAVGSVVGEPVTVKIDSQVYYYPETKPAAARKDKPDLDVQGVYLDKRNAIIQPKKMHAETLYFMREWWPLLKPVEYALIMVLRQRCYFEPDNSCQATYADLAKAINVSTKTVERMLERDRAGQFKSEYLGQFIKAVKTIRTKDSNNHVRNVGSKFVVVMDDPLTPSDAAKLAESL